MHNNLFQLIAKPNALLLRAFTIFDIDDYDFISTASLIRQTDASDNGISIYLALGATRVRRLADMLTISLSRHFYLSPDSRHY